jgi:hypothetical protein
MEQELGEIKNKILNLLKEIQDEWVAVELTIDFPPFINSGWNSTMKFIDNKGNTLDMYLPNIFSLGNDIIKFIYKFNQEGVFNQFQFSAKKNMTESANLVVLFNQEIEDNFQNSLPKKYKGKTIPWWKNPEETKGLE